MQTGNLEQRMQALQDRAALKSLVDTFSELADKKDVAKQVLLFTEDAVVDSFANGQHTSLKGRKNIAEVFAAFLANFDTVYHLNGQQTIQLQGDTATAVAYCQVVLTGTIDGKKVKTTMGVIYNDEYVRLGNEWLISKRSSNFTWQDSQELSPQQHL